MAFWVLLWPKARCLKSIPAGKATEETIIAYKLAWLKDSFEQVFRAGPGAYRFEVDASIWRMFRMLFR